MKVSIQETQPKLQENQQQKDINKQKMKFNWRANWETLLVLVIIVVGIVITTIAAIRNKGELSWQRLSRISSGLEVKNDQQ